VLAQVKDLSGKRVCDFGCGSGGNLRAMYNDKNRYTGFDVSEDALQEARTKFSRPNIEYIKISGDYPLPVTSGSFDIVTSFFTFEHLLEPPNSARRILPSAGG
jgi:2-polyprenyl-3-methyl-5-hydroxy-6-metoxy-1,4-benzoquinol methylase